jgi:hypothetical protein
VEIRTNRAEAKLATLGSPEQLLQRYVQFDRDRQQRQHGGIVGAAFQPANDVGVDTGLLRELFLAPVSLGASFANFFSQRP